MTTLSIVLPCFNEAENLPLILERFANVINRSDVEVILVDNGSTDKTPSILPELLHSYTFASSYRVPVNKGYGYGLLCGLNQCKGKYLAWTHADMQTDPYDVLRGLELLESSFDPSTVFVKGNRICRPYSDQFFTICMSFFCSFILKSRLWDINAQPNIVSRKFFTKFQSPPHDFSFDLYYYLMAVKNGLQIKRFNVRFHERIYGMSHWNINWQEKLKFIRRTLTFTFSLNRSLRSRRCL